MVNIFTNTGFQVFIVGVTPMTAFWIITLYRVTQGGSGGNVRILIGDNIGHCEGEKSSHEHVYFWMVTQIKVFEYGAHCCTACGGGGGLEKGQSLQKKGGHIRQIAH